MLIWVLAQVLLIVVCAALVTKWDRVWNGMENGKWNARVRLVQRSTWEEAHDRETPSGAVLYWGSRGTMAAIGLALAVRLVTSV